MIVYCVSRKPRGSTYHQNMLWLKPELFWVSVNTAWKLACLDGAKISTRISAEAPSTCQNTETPLRRATRWLPRMLMNTWAISSRPNSRKTSDSLCASSAKLMPKMSTL